MILTTKATTTTTTTAAKTITTTTTPKTMTMTSRLNLRLVRVSLVAILVALLVACQLTIVDGFIKFGYILNTTACDTCDELRTYSGRNVFCCLAQSKCCGPNSLDELDALTTTQVPLNP